MLVKEDQALRKQISQEKKKISADLGLFAMYLNYTGEGEAEGAEAEEEKAEEAEAEEEKAGTAAEAQQKEERRGIRRLKGTPVWTILYPARKSYKAVKYLYTNGIVKACQKAGNALENNRYKQKKEARKYLTQIMPTEEEKKKQREKVFSRNIKISILVPLYNTPEQFLRDMIQSVIGQTYENWELCLADASDADQGSVKEVVMEYAKDGRIIYQKLEKNSGIAENTNACIRMSSGNYLALFDHDDILHPAALFECASVIEQKMADFVYTDEATFEGESLENIVTYHFKPDFSIDNLRGVNYICHLSVFQKALLEKVGLFRPEYDGSQDHDLILRLTDAAECICHIPKILYFWRYHSMSTSMNLDTKSYAVEAGIHAVRDAEIRRGFPAKVRSSQICQTHYRMEYEIGTPKISVLIFPNGGGRGKIAHTAAAVEKISSYCKYELLYAPSFDEISETMQSAKGEYLLLFGAGTVPVTPTFMEELLMFAQRGDVGLAGMQVLDEQDLILSSDIVIGTTSDTLAVEVNRGGRYDAPGYMGRNYYAHNVSAVSGWACMGRKEEIAEIWALGKSRSVFARMLEACFHLRAKKRQIVLNPYALCKVLAADYREELSEADRHSLISSYREQILAGDPFYNKNLSLEKHWQKK